MTETEIEAKIDAKCPDNRKRKPESNAAVMQMALDVASGNLTTLNEAYNLFLLVNGILLGILALPIILRRAPALIIAFRAVARAQTSVAAQVTVIGRQIAANESLYNAAAVALRRAA